MSIVCRADLARATTIARRLERWYVSFGRDFPWRSWRSPYRLAVVEVLLQRTRAEAVRDFAPKFFGSYSGWAELAAADTVELQKFLRPLGLHVRRAASLKSLAVGMVAAPSGPLWESRPGIGQYIGRALRVGLFGEPLAMVDANFVRVVRRAFRGPWMADYRYDPRLQGLSQAIVDGARDSRRINWAILDLGARVCVPRVPRCGACPLESACETGRAHNDTSKRGRQASS
jgi:A/G-specific adenine glycosylase